MEFSFVNIAGLNTKDVRDIFRELNEVNLYPSIFGLVETHIMQDSDVDSVNIPGYNTVFAFSNSKHTGGVVLFIKDCFSFRIVRNITVHYEFWATIVEVIICGQTFLSVTEFAYQ